MRKPVQFLAHLPLGVVLAAGGMVLGLSEEPSAHTAASQAVGVIRMADVASPDPVVGPRAPAWSLAPIRGPSSAVAPADVALRAAARAEADPSPGPTPSSPVPVEALSAAADAALMRLHQADPDRSAMAMARDLSPDAVPLDDGSGLLGFLAMMAAYDPLIEGLSALTDQPTERVLTNLERSADVRRSGKATPVDAPSAVTFDPPSDLVSVFGKDSELRQTRLARWLSRTYRRDPMEVARFMRFAWESGARNGVDPLLIVAVMCIESSLDPQAVSDKGARGLMQVLVAAHEEKFDPFGGTGNAHHPRVSIEVGTRILKRMIAVAGSVEGALKHYVGARFFKSDGGYGAKVIRKRERVWAASMGHTIPTKPALEPAIEHANNAQAAVAAHASTAQR